MSQTIVQEAGELMQKKLQEQYFVRQYIDTRKKEHRLYTNDEVLQLPDIAISHVLSEEWQVRKKSARHLLKYLKKKKDELRILEVGCGNGWLTGFLAGLEQSQVVGLDINDVELTQALEVFGHLQNVRFLNADLETHFLQPQSFDIIVFAASIQYFPSVEKVVRRAQCLLAENGEIHILDTPFYKPGDIAEAKSRTEAYYTALGFPGMSHYYYHHSLADFSSFNSSLLFAPSFIQKRLLGNTHPFYWLKITGRG